MKLKNDHYRKVRGGKTKILNIICAKCQTLILQYQKDGDGSLHRCYLNRIASPENLVGLNNIFSSTKEMTNLICPKCKQLIGSPMKHSDGRLAFRLVKGNYAKAVNKEKF